MTFSTSPEIPIKNGNFHFHFSGNSNKNGTSNKKTELPIKNGNSNKKTELPIKQQKIITSNKRLSPATKDYHQQQKIITSNKRLPPATKELSIKFPIPFYRRFSLL